ncbi:MAG: PQQ-binding-like beta-propeller repeat protein [Planctomycetota bacterium]
MKKFMSKCQIPTDTIPNTKCNLSLALLLVCWLLPGLFFPTAVRGHDWPMWRYDAGRRAASPEELPAQMYLQWVRELPPPRPAWPESQDRLQFDASYEPVVAGKTVFVGSMVSDCVTAYDTESGEEKWRFYTDGPVRFAPVVYKDRLYVACDDGYLYCLNAGDGSLVRRFLAGPSENKVLGNDRLIGMWPMRGGPVLLDGKIYFAASIWPFMGTFIYAIDAETGDVVWENSGSASTFLMQPHTSPAFAGVAPQGYMVATEDKLLVSGGRSTPAAYDRRTGGFLYYRLKDYGKTGTCEVMASDKYFFNRGAIHGLSDGYEIAKAPASVTAEDVFFSSRNNTIAAYRLDQETKKAVEFWKAELPTEVGKIHMKAGSRLYCTDKDQEGKILAVDMPLNDGPPGGISWQAQVDGEVWSMLAANGKLLVVTLQGSVYCFGDKRTEPKSHRLRTRALPDVTPAVKDKVRQILETTGEKEGYALLLGLSTGEFLYELLNQSELHIIALDPDSDKVAAVRRELNEAGLYGNRAAVHVGDIMTSQLPPYMANLVVAADLKAAGFQKDGDFIERLFRALRPYGGTACFLLPREKHGEAFKQVTNSELLNCTITSSDQLLCVTRSGPLPGSADWTHQYGDPANTVMSKDTLKAPLGLLWFGGPPNDKVLPRHGHGPSPQVVDGRLFIEGRNMLRAVDVYTGRLLWERQFQDLGKFYDNTSHQPGANEIGSNYVTVHDAVYVVYGETIHVLDPATGATTRELSLPGEDRPHWGTILVREDLLLATASPIHVPLPERTKNKESAPKIDNLPAMTLNAEYASSSKMLVAMNRHTGKILWTRDAEYSFRHNTIVIGPAPGGDGKVFCIDGMSRAKLAFLERRGISFDKEPTLYALDSLTGQTKWKTNEGVFGTWLAYSGEHDVLLQAGSHSGDRAKDEADRGMAAYRGSDGEELWRTDDSYKGPPILYHDRVITQTGGGSASAPAEARAYDLLNGETVMHKHPMTGETIPWTWLRFKGCNTAIASENLLTFRSASGAFVDLAAGQGTASIGGFKSGCTSNLIIANGVLNAPDYTRTCTCSYQNQASLALIHMPEVAYWTFDYYPNPSQATPVRQVGINFGAPGNRYAENGTLWLEFPSVGGPSPDVPVRATYENPKWFRYHSSQVKDEHNWITASGATGLKEVRIRMFIQPGKNPSAVDAFDKHIEKIPTWSEDRIEGAFEQPRDYTVRLYFAEAENIEVGRRVFDVLLQGERVLENFDIVKEAGRANRTVIKEFKGIKIKDDLRVAFTGKTEDHGPLLCGIEIIAEDW